MADALLDTTFFIDYHRGDVAARSLWLQIRERRLTASVSVVTIFELWVGELSRREDIEYRAMLAAVEEVPLTTVEAETAALWLRGLSLSVSEAIVRDAFIAATAAGRGEPIYTRNVRDFKRFYTDVQTY